MSVKKEIYGKNKDGRDVFLFSIQNANGMTAKVTNYGAVLVSLLVKNKLGTFLDVVLGYNKLEEYFDNYPMFGATVGRNVNRIENAEFQIDGIVFKLAKNRGRHNIHSDKEKGFHKVLWDFEITDENSVKFYYVSRDGEQGFPGNLKVSVTYSVSEENGLIISYSGISDKKTLINMTNHTYFNLGGHDSGEILDTEVSINAKNYTPVNEDIIPTGEIHAVSGTPMDFSVPKLIEEVINTDFLQLKFAGGFDHNYMIENPHTGLRKIAEAKNHFQGITMEVYSDLPGMQFYTGNSLKKMQGKNEGIYGKYSGFCMEPQYFPNSINVEGFEKPVFDKGKEYKTSTIYQFV
ncbi:aldose epimerase family protein [Anaerosacchariphilus polymeriproducens]|uniref:Aldose 1-epimerase n=1 Tax=Anaerosacchariphilus polymeriproducens TaxID=1812858 RepID=A0A371AZL5_9FIRM|nr:aldose epimerase family protein [Anaerosacchariphilus polymeriproducens]RDU24989.1 galactose mutarotase [Anaerosacchariphilus polymeriproducens]